jgi:hypothetical protein
LAMPWRIWLVRVSRRGRTEGGGGRARRDRDLPHRAELAKEVEKLLWSNVEAVVGQ